MRRINKGGEPASLRAWKRANPQSRYRDLSDSVRQDIRQACMQEQFYLCAYCCQKITGLNADTMNEHVEAQNLAPQRGLDFNNIVASCTTKNQCDHSHKSQALPLTPLMAECESQLRFKISGRVEGLTEQAVESIRVLNLGDNERNNRRLIEMRKQLVDALLWKNGIDPNDGLDDDELIQSVVSDICMPVSGRLDSYAPVVVNILKNWLAA